MDDDIKDQLKVTALLKEYEEIRKEVRMFEIIEISSIYLAILTFISIFIIGVLSSNYIFIFIAPSISIFFIISGMGIHAYTINLGIRSSQISGKLKKILGESTIEWENTVGVFGSMHENIFTKKITKYWIQLAILTIIVGITTVIIGLLYSFIPFSKQVGLTIPLFFVGFYIIIAFLSLYLGYKLRTWEKVNVKI
jgi:hypothetical protein